MFGPGLGKIKEVERPVRLRGEIMADTNAGAAQGSQLPGAGYRSLVMVLLFLVMVLVVIMRILIRILIRILMQLLEKGHHS